jgi:hypothetical protein
MLWMMVLPSHDNSPIEIIASPLLHHEEKRLPSCCIIRSSDLADDEDLAELLALELHPTGTTARFLRNNPVPSNPTPASRTRVTDSNQKESKRDQTYKTSTFATSQASASTRANDHSTVHRPNHHQRSNNKKTSSTGQGSYVNSETTNRSPTFNEACVETGSSSSSTPATFAVRHRGLPFNDIHPGSTGKTMVAVVDTTQFQTYSCVRYLYASISLIVTVQVSTTSRCSSILGSVSKKGGQNDGDTCPRSYF